MFLINLVVDININTFHYKLRQNFFCEGENIIIRARLSTPKQDSCSRDPPTRS